MYLLVFVPSKARLMHKVGLGFMERAYGTRLGLGPWDWGTVEPTVEPWDRRTVGPWGHGTVGSWAIGP